MVKRIFEAIEAMTQAVTYLLILLMGLMLAGLGAFVILGSALRIGQFLWAVLFAENWI